MIKKTNYSIQFSLAILSFYNDESTLKKVREDNLNLLLFFEQMPGVKDFFLDLTIIKERKIEALEKIFAADKLEQFYCNGLMLFLEHSHASYFFDLLKEIDKTALELLKIKKVFVQSATALTPTQITRLEAGWRKKYLSNLIFEYSVVPELVLGIQIRVEDYIEDYTLKSHLKALKEKVLKETV